MLDWLLDNGGPAILLLRFDCYSTATIEAKRGRARHLSLPTNYRISIQSIMTPEKDGLDVSHVSGNAPDHIKRVLSNTAAFFANRHPDKIEGKIFVEDMQKRFKVTEVSISQKVEEPNKLEGRVVVETEVMEGTLFLFVSLADLKINFRRRHIKYS